MAKAPTQAQRIEQLEAAVAALADRLERMEARSRKRDRVDASGNEKPARERPSRQVNDDDNLDKPQTIMRDPVRRIRTRSGKVVSRVVQPR